jgi:hypothetical protein
MSRDISERDWKIFRELHKVALNRLCERILTEARAEIDRGDQTPHERYLRLFKLIQDRDDDVARAFNDFRRSTAQMQLGIIASMGLLTQEEIERFGPEARRTIELFSRGPGV